MKVLIIVSGSEQGFWLSELSHPYYLLTERAVEVDLASPLGGKTRFAVESDPNSPNSSEPDDLISKGFLTDQALLKKVETTLDLRTLDLTNYDAVHVVGGGGAAIDLYPNEDVGRVLEHFFSTGKVVGAICHGAMSLANLPDRIRGRQVTGYTREEDRLLEFFMGKDFIPNFPQPTLEKAGAKFLNVEPHGVCVVIDEKLVTGQNQQSASEYTLALLRIMTGKNPVITV